jgi:hypothetical protein
MSTTRNIIEGIKNVTSEGVTKAQVGLGSVDNTTDANKPVSTATQTALNGKAPIASPTFTGDLRADRLIAYGSGGRTSNVAVGAGSLNSNISEVQITAVGENALYNNTGGYNTAIGKDALYNNTTGIVNTGIGLNALKYKQDGSINTNFNYCTGLGFETRVGGNNATAIGCYASAPASCVALGTSNERTLVGGAVDNGTDRLQVNGSIKSTYAPISDLNVTYDGIDLSTFAKAGAYVAIVASNYPSGNADEYYYIEQICHNESWILQRATRMTDFKGSGVAGLGVTNQRIKIGVTWQGWKQVTN